MLQLWQWQRWNSSGSDSVEITMCILPWQRLQLTVLWQRWQLPLLSQWCLHRCHTNVNIAVTSAVSVTTVSPLWQCCQCHHCHSAVSVTTVTALSVSPLSQCCQCHHSVTTVTALSVSPLSQCYQCHHSVTTVTVLSVSQCHTSVVAALSVCIASTPLLLPSLSQCYLQGPLPSQHS